MAKSAQEMVMEKRAIKQRQNATARAKAKARSGAEAFSLSDTRKEAARRAKAQRLAKANGERLIETVLKQGVKVLRCPDIQMDDEGDLSLRWLRDCRDVIAAAKAHEQRFQWNRHWESEGKLVIGLVKLPRRLAKAA